MLAADRLVIDGEIVLLGAPDLPLGAHEIKFLRAERTGEADEARHLALLQIAEFNFGRALGHQLVDVDDGRRAACARGWSQLLRVVVDGPLDVGRRERHLRRGRRSRRGCRSRRHRLQSGRGNARSRRSRLGSNRRRGRRGLRCRSRLGRGRGRLELALDAEIVITDLDQIPFLHGRRTLDLVAVDPDPGVAAEILDHHHAVALPEARVLARDIALGELDRVPVLATDRHFVAHNWDDCFPAFVVLDDELHFFLCRLERWAFAPQ